MKALAFLLILASAAAGGWAWWEHSERLQAQEDLAAMTRERNRFEKSARESISKLTLNSGTDIKASGPTGLDEQLKDLGITLNDDTKKKPGKESMGRSPGEIIPHGEGADLSKLLTDPAVRQSLRAQADAQLELIYADFFKEIHLAESKRNAVLVILKERQGAQTDLGLSVFDKSLKAAARKAAADRLSISAKEADTKLREVLASDYAAFAQFEKSAPERELLAAFTSMLKEKEIADDEGAKKKLMDVMFQDRQAFTFDRDLSDLKTVKPDDLTEAVIDRYMEQYSKLQQQIQGRAKSILTPEQYEVFLKAQEDQQHATQTHLQWLRQLSGPPSEASGKD